MCRIARYIHSSQETRYVLRLLHAPNVAKDHFEAEKLVEIKLECFDANVTLISFIWKGHYVEYSLVAILDVETNKSCPFGLQLC